MTDKTNLEICDEVIPALDKVIEHEMSTIREAWGRVWKAARRRPAEGEDWVSLMSIPLDRQGASESRSCSRLDDGQSHPAATGL